MLSSKNVAQHLGVAALLLALTAGDQVDGLKLNMDKVTFRRLSSTPSPPGSPKTVTEDVAAVQQPQETAVQLDAVHVDVAPREYVDASKKVTVYFMRHGQSTQNADQDNGDLTTFFRADAPLTEVGMKQAAKAGETIMTELNRDEAFAFVSNVVNDRFAFAASPLNRAYTTLLVFLATLGYGKNSEAVPTVNILKYIQEINNVAPDRTGYQHGIFSGPFMFTKLMPVTGTQNPARKAFDARSQLKWKLGVKRSENFNNICERVFKWEGEDAGMVFHAYSANKASVSAVDGTSGNLTPRGQAVASRYSTGLLSRKIGTPFQKAARDLFDVAKSKESKTVLTAGHSSWFNGFMEAAAAKDNGKADGDSTYSQWKKYQADLYHKKLHNAQLVKLELTFDGSGKYRVTSFKSIFDGLTGSENLDYPPPEEGI